MRKVRLSTGPASPHAGPDEIIREFTDGYMHGGLISLRVVDDEQRPVRVEIYRTEGEVSVLAAPADIAAAINQSDAAELVVLLMRKFPALAASTEPPTVPLTGGRVSWYLKDNGEWVRADVDAAATPGLYTVELPRSEPISRVYDVPADRVRWTE